MSDTGRIRKALDWRARRIVFGDHADAAIRDELPHSMEIDRAHVVMLVERGLLPRDAGRRLLAAMQRLAADEYAPLKGRSVPLWTMTRALLLRYCEANCRTPSGVTRR